LYKIASNFVEKLWKIEKNENWQNFADWIKNEHWSLICKNLSIFKGCCIKLADFCATTQAWLKSITF
jgi:hypothetical protein